MNQASIDFHKLFVVFFVLDEKLKFIAKQDGCLIKEKEFFGNIIGRVVELFSAINEKFSLWNINIF